MLDKYVTSPLLLLSFASIAVAAVEKGYAFVFFGGCAASAANLFSCLLYTSPSPRDATLSRMPSSA